MIRRGIFVLTLLCLLLAVTPIAAAQGDQRCFPETGQCISGRIREFWEQNGGLPVFGYPTGAQSEIQIEGKPFQAQWFERNRLELHPENQRPYDVLLGRLGVDRLVQQGRDWFTFRKDGEWGGPGECRLFAETEHSVCSTILAVWRGNGLELDGKRGHTDIESLALFGAPLSEAHFEKLPNGNEYIVQWFERARFEFHDENEPPYQLLFGLLGNEIRENPVVDVGTPTLLREVQESQPTPPSEDLNTHGQNVYNCSDFATWDAANAVYQANLPGDPNDLDRDNDGIPCEDLPGAP
jgi:hypothetical protein